MYMPSHVRDSTAHIFFFGFRLYSGDMSDSSEDLTAHRRPSAVQFRLDLNLEHPPGPISTPKGGFKTRELLLRTPAQGILKCM
jgi:hypothetical protein